ncbi:MAG: DMT family transporter [Faecalibacterium sp.]|nr:DMT family transporter [Ruminococcus sp.]MCM1392151.1 DMT family transporter [Ruminococcus sp.]MCM1485889.1 DMT family transporter [Faecalibacterium sp.]
MKKSYLKYILALLLFGTNGIVASFINMSSHEIVLLRTLLGSVLLLAIFLISKGKFTFYKHTRHFIFLTISGIAMGASWMFLYEAYARIGVGISSLLYYCGPVIVMILSPLLFKEKLTAFKIIGFLSVLCGIFLINSNAFDTKSDIIGMLCGLASAVMYAFMVIFNKKSKNITGLENSMLQLIISFLTVAVFTGIKQGFAINIPRTSILPIIILGLLNTGIGCYLYFSSIGNLSVQSVAICGYLEPLSAVMFSVLFLKEFMLPIQMIGAVLILGGAIFGECAKSRKSQL